MAERLQFKSWWESSFTKRQVSKLSDMVMTANSSEHDLSSELEQCQVVMTWLAVLLGVDGHVPQWPGRTCQTLAHVWPGDDTMRRSSDWAPEMNFRCAVSCRQRIYCRHRLSAHSHYGCNTLAVYCAAICLILTRWCAKHPLSIKLHFVSAWLHDAITGCCGCCFVGLLVGCWARMTVAPFEVTMKLLRCTSLLWQPATVVSASCGAPHFLLQWRLLVD